MRPESSSNVAFGNRAVLMLARELEGRNYYLLFFKAATIAMRVASNAFPS